MVQRVHACTPPPREPAPRRNRERRASTRAAVAQLFASSGGGNRAGRLLAAPPWKLLLRVSVLGCVSAKMCASCLRKCYVIGVCLSCVLCPGLLCQLWRERAKCRHKPSGVPILLSERVTALALLGRFLGGEGGICLLGTKIPRSDSLQARGRAHGPLHLAALLSKLCCLVVCFWVFMGCVSRAVVKTLSFGNRLTVLLPKKLRSHVGSLSLVPFWAGFRFSFGGVGCIIPISQDDGRGRMFLLLLLSVCVVLRHWGHCPQNISWNTISR